CGVRCIAPILSAGSSPGSLLAFRRGSPAVPRALPAAP
ncbi:MAG: hypothetical protein AVDCRST_MAG68-4115, partial [uncultured Gemmatimonadetes bacterium]